MILEKISDTEYEVVLYDWVTGHRDYKAGSIKRCIDTEGLLSGDVNDKHYWMFYPITQIPINCGDLKDIFTKLSDFNHLIE